MIFITLVGLQLLLRPAAAASPGPGPGLGASNVLLAVCPESGKSTLSTSEVRLRPGSAHQCSWTLHSSDGLPVCRLRVAILMLDLPCAAGSLQIGSESFCGGLLGSRTVDLPQETLHVPVTFSFVGSGKRDFDVVVGLEGCVKEEPEVVANHDCGGLYQMAVDAPVGLLSPGYPAQYPERKNCLYVLQHQSVDPGPPACFLDLEFVDFTVESSAGCKKDRLTVEGMEDAVFCGSRAGSTRIELKDRREARLRFLSDEEGSAGGFRVLAKLSRCEAVGDPRQEAVTSTETLRPEGAMSELLGPGPPVPFPPGRWPPCCRRVHNDPRFFITSPGFPMGLGGASCVFPIARISPGICRLRLILHQFLLAGPCDKHFLDVDGRRICACRSHTQVVSFFRSPQETVKMIRYYRMPYTAGGFIIEVLQEDCSRPPNDFRPRSFPLREGYPAATSTLNMTSIKRSVDPNLGTDIGEDVAYDNITGRSERIMFGGTVRFPDDNHHHPELTEGSQATFQSPETTLSWDVESHLNSMDGNSSSSDSPLWESAVYWNYTSADGEDSLISDESLEELYASVTKGQVDDKKAALGYGVCGAPTFKDWLYQAARWASTVPSPLVQCPVGTFPPIKCLGLRSPVGWFTSPRYPDLYPNNIRACYRIVRLPGQCGVRISMMDFNLEPSPTCSKDYISFGGSSRYCGGSLSSSLLNLDFMTGTYVDILFVTDGAVTGRGFRAFYRQLPCGGIPVGGAPGLPPSRPVGPGAGGPFPFPPPIPPLPPGDIPAVPVPPGGPFPNPVGAPAPAPAPAPGPFPFPIPFPRPVPVSAGAYQPSGAPEQPPPSPPQRTPPAPTPQSARTCGGDILQQHFTLTAHDVAGQRDCVFTVRKITEDICGLQILPERIRLDCRREVVVVDGRTLCGPEIRGQTVTLDFLGDSIEIVYSADIERLETQGDFLFQMQQVADCLELDVTPVARVGKSLQVTPTPMPVPACVIELAGARGGVHAPALEPRSPHDLSCSYVFRQRPGSCYIRLDFHEFLLAAGPICTESYLALRNHKYCAEDLRHSSHVFTFSSPHLEVPYHLQKDIPFAVWNITYSQISCHQKPSDTKSHQKP